MSSSFFNKHKEESEGWKSHHGGINKINFQEEKELRDNYAALGCITVLTSNQVIGTLTHLDTSDIINVDTFVLFLDLELGDDKKNSRVILAGGSGLKQSQELYKA